jgi:hypothetical protein
MTERERQIDEIIEEAESYLCAVTTGQIKPLGIDDLMPV